MSRGASVLPSFSAAIAAIAASARRDIPHITELPVDRGVSRGAT